MKGYFSTNGDFAAFEDLSNLRVYVPHPGYMPAMKCLALRTGEEFQDLEDVKVLIGALGIHTPPEAESILARYYPLDRYPAKARYVLEELLDGQAA